MYTVQRRRLSVFAPAVKLGILVSIYTYIIVAIININDHLIANITFRLHKLIAIIVLKPTTKTLQQVTLEILVPHYSFAAAHLRNKRGYATSG